MKASSGLAIVDPLQTLFRFEVNQGPSDPQADDIPMCFPTFLKIMSEILIE